MGERANGFSVTDVDCGCGWLEDAANDPGKPVVFDKEVGEYQIVYGPGGGGRMVIYHCPLCGGCAPRSKRHLLFAVISAAESGRLERMLEGIGTLEEAVKRLGRADREGMLSSAGMVEREGSGPWVVPERTLVYERLSEVADVWFREREDGSAWWGLQGKYVG